MIEQDKSNSKIRMEKKIDKFGEILQKFGLDLIQNIGQMKHQLEVVVKKVEKIEKEIIDLKGIKNNLQKNSSLRSKILDDSVRIKNKLENLSSKIDSILEIDENNIKISKSYNNPDEVLEDLEKNVNQAKNIYDLSEYINDTKENLYILTGGHKILMELRKFEYKLKPGMDIHKEHVLEDLKKKIIRWKKEI